MRIAGIVEDSIVDGPGLRFTVFTQGCNFCCEGCHNPDTWDVSGGEDVSADDLIAQMRRNPLTDGLTLSGGEPFLQPDECVKLAAAARENGLNVWVFSGYTFEQLLHKPECKELLELTDVVVDGPFVLSERSLSLRWRGSRNQRVVDVVESLRVGVVVEKLV